MAANNAELLLERFEENVTLEKFFLEQRDQSALVSVLRDQEDLLPELLRQMKTFPAGDSLWNRLRLAADTRALQEELATDLLGGISREIGRLRQSTKRLHDWQKAWRPPEEHCAQFAGTYA
jgi:hypothetical protein